MFTDVQAKINGKMLAPHFVSISDFYAASLTGFLVLTFQFKVEYHSRPLFEVHKRSRYLHKKYFTNLAFLHNRWRFWGQKLVKKRAGTSKPFWECSAQSAGSRHTTNVHSETWQKSPSERCVSVLFDLSLPRVCQVCELPFLFHYSYVWHPRTFIFKILQCHAMDLPKFDF